MINVDSSKKSKMVEQPAMVEGGVGKMTLQSSSAATSPLPLQPSPPDFRRYPPPLASYEEVVASPTLFRGTLEKLHGAMGTKFMIPIVGGRELDLHRLFVEVTSRGGIAKVLQERRWREIIGAFSFPSSATNASFILRKYYFSLLHHYEQIYLYKADGWSPAARDALQFSSYKVTPRPRGRVEHANSSSPVTQEESTKILSQAIPAATTGSEVHGVIDGKFECGYLITVRIGSTEYKGVLYQYSSNPSDQGQVTSVDQTNSSVAELGGSRRKRRKKSEIKKRDPDHPKPNRSGYNFFFSEQHARLKPLYPGRDREISRMIGDAWNKLKENERTIYQEKALKDKERYKVEMESYRKRLKNTQIISSALPIAQQPLLPHSGAAMDVYQKPETTLSRSHENLMGSNLQDKSNIEPSVGQTTASGDVQLQTLGPETLLAKDAPGSSGNYDARQGENRNDDKACSGDAAAA